MGQASVEASVTCGIDVLAERYHLQVILAIKDHVTAVGL